MSAISFEIRLPTTGSSKGHLDDSTSPTITSDAKKFSGNLRPPHLQMAWATGLPTMSMLGLGRGASNPKLSMAPCRHRLGVPFLWQCGCSDPARQTSSNPNEYHPGAPVISGEVLTYKIHCMNQFLVSSHPVDAFKSEAIAAMHFRNMALPSAHFHPGSLWSPCHSSGLPSSAWHQSCSFSDISSGMRKLVMEWHLSRASPFLQLRPMQAGEKKKLSKCSVIIRRSLDSQLWRNWENKGRPNLVVGFNPSEKYSSYWIISPGMGENEKYLTCHHLETRWTNSPRFTGKHHRIESPHLLRSMLCSVFLTFSTTSWQRKYMELVETLRWRSMKL